MNFLTKHAVKQMVVGLVLMTINTLFWTFIAYYGINTSPYRWLLAIFVVTSSCFLYHAFRLKLVLKKLTTSSSASLKDLRMREKLFMIICAAEGIGIFIAVNLVIKFHHPELIVPAIGLGVGLHFFPLAKVFQRKMDIYIGIWSILISILAITLSLNHTLNTMHIITFTGCGMAIATTCYGVNMTFKARQVSKF